VQCSSHIVTINILTPSFLYRPDALPVAQLTLSVRPVKGKRPSYTKRKIRASVRMDLTHVQTVGWQINFGNTANLPDSENCFIVPPTHKKKSRTHIIIIIII